MKDGFKLNPDEEIKQISADPSGYESGGDGVYVLTTNSRIGWFSHMSGKWSELEVPRKKGDK